VIGHVFEPTAFSAGDKSDLTFEGNTATNVTYTATSREFIFVDYRTNASGGKLKILNNSFDMPSAGTQQMMELRFRQTNPSTVSVQVDGNVGTGSTSTVAYLDIDAEAAATVGATVTDNVFTNSNGTPGFTIDFASETATSSLCANVTGNTLNGGAGSINLNEAAGSMTVTQANAAAVAAANGIPGGNVTVAGTPTFGAPACTLP
jgi:hypothetical protein